MNANYVNVMIESTVTVLSTMAMIEAKPGQPSRKTNDTPLGDVTGIIDLSGAAANGSLAISFSEPAILDITEKLLGEESAGIDETVVDVVGELTNMITGNAKRLFSEQGVEFDLTRPAMQVGQEQAIKHRVNGDLLLLPLTTPRGDIYLEFCFL